MSDDFDDASQRPNPWKQDADLSDGLHEKQETVIEGPVSLHIGNLHPPEPPSVQFHPVIAPTVPPQTQRTFESMRVMIRNGAIALIVLGFIVAMQMVTQIWGGIRESNRDKAQAVSAQEAKDLTAELIEQEKYTREVQARIAQQTHEDNRAILNEMKRRNNLADK